MLDNLFKEIQLMIFTYLPIRDICHIICLNKEYCELIDNTKFWSILLKRDYPKYIRHRKHAKLYYRMYYNNQHIKHRHAQILIHVIYNPTEGETLDHRMTNHLYMWSVHALNMKKNKINVNFDHPIIKVNNNNRYTFV